MDEVWTGTVVTDDVLARCISELRKALGDKARSPRYVETIRKRGYRLIAPVETEVAAPTAPTPGSAPAPLAAPAARPGPAGLEGDGHGSGPPGLALRRPELPRRTRPAALGWAIVAAGVVAVGAVAAYQAGVAGVRPLAASPVTSYPGDERDPALSPDGEQVAFAWGRRVDGRRPPVRPLRAAGGRRRPRPAHDAPGRRAEPGVEPRRPPRRVRPVRGRRRVRGSRSSRPRAGPTGRSSSRRTSRSRTSSGARTGRRWRSRPGAGARAPSASTSSGSPRAPASSA